MPQAVTHVLVPIILLSIFRHIYTKKTGKKFPMQYVLIGGIAGIIPDLDIPIYWVMHYFNYNFEQIHRTISHTIFIPLIFETSSLSNATLLYFQASLIFCDHDVNLFK